MKNGDWRKNVSPSTRNEYRRQWFVKLRYQILDALGGKCAQCGYSDYRALQIDHISGDSTEDKKKSGTSYYYNILKQLDTGKYQCLCANCNTIKRRENQETPLANRDGPNKDEQCVKG